MGIRLMLRVVLAMMVVLVMGVLIVRIVWSMVSFMQVPLVTIWIDSPGVLILMMQGLLDGHWVIAMLPVEHIVPSWVVMSLSVQVGLLIDNWSAVALLVHRHVRDGSVSQEFSHADVAVLLLHKFGHGDVVCVQEGTN